MYCGSCFRDNGLAAELIARGHDVTLIPVYTPTRTDETNVSRPDVLFGGISVYLQQYSALFRRTPRFLDRLWDSPRVIEAFAGRGISPDARVLGEMTISTLQGEQGVLRKEFEKLIEWTKDEPPPDVINLPNSLLIAMAAPLKRAFRRPVLCTLQGEELFLSELAAPYRDRAVALIRDQVRHVDQFIAVSEYCAEFMTRYLSDSRGPHVGRAARHQHGWVRAPPARPIETRSIASGTSRGLRRRKACTSWPRRTCDSGVGGRCTHRVARGRLHGAGSSRLSREGARRPQAGRSGRRVHVPRRAGPRREAGVSAQPERAVRSRHLRRAEGDVPARVDGGGVPVVQPRRGAFTEVVEKTGGGLLVAPDDPEALADGLHRLWSGSRAVGAAGEQGLRRRARSLHDCGIGDPAARGVRTGESSRQRRSAVLKVSDVGKQYPTPRGPLTVLSDVSFALSPAMRPRLPDPRGAGRARCCTCSARSSRRRRARSRSTGRIHSISPRPRWPTSGTPASGSCFRITACCRSAPCSRTCSCRRWWPRTERKR